MLPKDFKAADHNESSKYYFVDLDKHGLPRKELLNKFFSEFMNTFITNADEVEEIIKLKGITDRHLFEYTTFDTGYLVKEDAIYTVKYEYVHGTRKETLTYFNVYVGKNSYADLALNTIAEAIVMRRFPTLFAAPFVTIERRFKESIHDMPKSINAKISDIDHMVLFDNDLRIKDILDIYRDFSCMDEMAYKPLVDVYASGDMYLTLDNKKASYSINFTFNDLFNGAWGSIEEHYMFSICYYDEDGNLIPKKWFNGKQKDAPYFNYPLVEEFKKAFFKANVN